MTQMTEGARDQAQQTMSQAGDMISQGAQQAKDQAGGQLRSQLDQRSTQAGVQVTSFADTLRTTGDQLRTDGNTRHADIVSAVADRVDDIGRYLRDKDGGTILNDVERYARRQPWVTAVAGLAVGLAASRFLKASSERRYRELTSGPTGSWETGYASGGYPSYTTGIVEGPTTAYPERPIETGQLQPTGPTPAAGTELEREGWADDQPTPRPY